MYYYSRAWYVIGSDWWVSSNNTWEWLSPLSGHIFHSLVHFHIFHSLVYFHSTSPVLSFLSGILFNISNFEKSSHQWFVRKNFPRIFPITLTGTYRRYFSMLSQILVHIVHFGKRSARILEICIVYGHVYVGIFVSIILDNLFVEHICMKWCKIV